jgi:hypothetical protein
MPLIQTVNVISDLAQKFNLQNAPIYVDKSKLNIGTKSIPSANKNPYDGKIPDIGYYYLSDYPIATSSLGTPVYTNLVFKGGSYTNSAGKQSTFADVELQTVLLQVSQAKKIIKTEIQGRDGTVKEYIGMDDYHISVNAIINGSNGYYPAEDVSTLKQILDAPVTIDVACNYLLMLGIKSIVVESYAFEQQAGMYSQQKVSINCISDTPIILQSASFT